jgi:DsbC/DsbD-like thiol-disulfide interchange protein
MIRGIFFLTVFGFSFSYAERSAPATVTVELISEKSSIQLGTPVRLGLHFLILKGWHIYWKNPGESGLPVRVEWQLPQEFKASELQWPIPHWIRLLNLVNFGYEDEVLLPIALESTVSQKRGASITFKGTVKWLACQEVCVPGKSSVVLTLPIFSQKPIDSSNAEFFRRVEKTLPQPIPKEWKLVAHFENRQFQLIIEGLNPLGKATVFFPDAQNVIDESSSQAIEQKGERWRMQFKAAELLTTPPSNLRGLLVEGVRSFEVDVPLTR